MNYAISIYPFYSNEAQYVWVAFGRAYFPVFSDAPPPIDTLLADFQTALGQIRAGLAARGLSDDWVGDAFDKAEKAFAVWAAQPGSGASVATTVMQELASGLSTVEQELKPDDPGARNLVAAIARCREAATTSIEFAASPTPELSRAMWNLAKICPIQGKGVVQTTLSDIWKDALSGRKTWMDKNPTDPFSVAAKQFSDALLKAEPVINSGDCDSDTLRAAATEFAMAARGMGSALRALKVPEAQEALTQILAQTYGRAAIQFRRLQAANRPVGAQRGPITIGSSQMAQPADPAWGPDKVPDPEFDLPGGSEGE